MKAEISNHGFRREKHYSGVHQQQGRMLTDRDWNDFAEIVRQRLDTALDRVVRSGAPRGGGLLDGFTEAPDGTYTAGLRKSGGWVVVDGIVAELLPEKMGQDFSYTNQADFTDPPAMPAQPRVLYVDVWERTVISLEDQELLDVALHGADTTFRCQTMAQLKCARKQGKPEDADRNPPIGTASLDLSLRAENITPDPCDPCAKDIKLDETVGNYLFRLEVHDVTYDANSRDPTGIVLKWSSDNAGTQYALEGVPADFGTGGYVYEYYSDATEKHLGVHLVPAADVPAPGVLEEEFSPTPPDPAHTYVRRWDGSCVLQKDGGAWKLAEDGGTARGMDRGVRLSTTSGAEDHGNVAFDSAGVAINLNALALELTLGNERFVRGDYWLALARERAGENDRIKVLREAPIGVRHHYLKLGEIDAGGRIGGLTDEDRRRFTFPPLTDITARDVGYQTDCPSGLFDQSHNNVEKALNQICRIEAGHIGFTKPCNTSIYKDVQLNSLKTVEDALELLCDVRAEQIGYDPEKCQYAKDEKAVNVQKALDAFCQRLQAPYLALRHVGGDGQQGPSGEELPCPLIVGVEDENGRPQKGVKVVFRAMGDDVLAQVGDASNAGATIAVPTGEDGLAAVMWRFGGKRGCRHVVAALAAPPQDNALEIVFEAVAGTPETWPTVTKVSWRNDRPLTLTAFNKDGLAVKFSEPMSVATASTDTFVVTLDVPVRSETISGYSPFVVAGRVAPKQQAWKFAPSGITDKMLGRWIKDAQIFKPRHPGIRCRVTLKANAILDKAGKRPLDGDAVVALSSQKDPTTKQPFSDLILPSGNGAPGGDFESWFYLTETPSGPRPTPGPAPGPRPTPQPTPGPRPTPGPAPGPRPTARPGLTPRRQPASPPPRGTLVNINTATVAELTTLPGVNTEMAQRIVRQRPYAKVDDLQRVQGIGPRRLQQLRPLVRF